MSEDYYALLDIDREASQEAILEAYRQKAAEHHPDVNDAPDAEETFQQLNHAKEVLTDKRERRLYDRWGHERYQAEAETGEQTSGSEAQSPASESPESGANPIWSRQPPEAGLGNLFELFGRPNVISVNGMPSRIGGSLTGSPRGIDLERYARRGASTRGTKTSSIHSDQDSEHQCPKCRGRGSFVHEYDTNTGRGKRIEPCESCSGTGVIEQSDSQG